LRAGALALGGLALSDVLKLRAQAGQQTADTAVILFWMWGGPSHLETYDPKPAAPAEYRGPFAAIATSTPGMEVSEVFPRQAKLGHRIALLRSLHHEMSAHNDGSIEVLTGKTPAQPDPTSTARSEHPDFGMVTSRLRGQRPDGLPQYVGIPRQPFMTRPTYLGLAHGALSVGDPSAASFKPPNLTLAAGMNGSRLGDRAAMLRQFDHLRRHLDQNAVFDGMERFRAQALEILTHPTVADAFDISRESNQLRDRYGRHLWGQSCLLARRLAEAGTSVITIDALAPTMRDRYFSWDDHINVQTRWDLRDAMRYRAAFMDQAISALIEDIYDRGLDRRVLVLALGEFGRTPRLTHADGLIGRDHWPAAMSALVAGGGLRMGQVIGATNSKGEYPSQRPLRPQDLLATVYRHLGIDARVAFRDFRGRPFPILADGEPIAELV
jgi:hypothetical protein